MPFDDRPTSDTMPPGFACVECRYDIAGLPWGAHCPECGYPTPPTWPTTALIEAHPAFVRFLRDRFRGIARAQLCNAVSLAGLAMAVVISLTPSLEQIGILLGWIAVVLLLFGLVLLAIDLVHLAISHRKRRPNLDFPHGKAITLSTVLGLASLLALPFFAVASFAMAPWSLMGCVVIPLLSISAISTVFLICNTFMHASTTMERCGESPKQTSPQRIIGIVLLIWPSTTIYAMAKSNDIGIGLSMLVFFALLATLHGLRMRSAQHVIAQVLRRRIEAIAADQPHEPRRS